MTITEIRQIIHQEIDQLSEEKLNQVLQFIQQVNQENNSQSTTYKQVLAEGWAKKYAHC